MSEQPYSPHPHDLVIRPGQADDWPRVAPIVAETWEGHDYIDQPLWARWAADPVGHLAVGERDGEIAVLCKITQLGPAEWWLEGLRVNPDLRRRGYATVIQDYIIRWFEMHGDGILRLSTYSENEAVQRLVTRHHFRLLNSYVEMGADAWATSYQNFRKLQPANLELVYNYLRHSPLYRVNRFVEHHWRLYYLTRERLAGYLAHDQIQVLGWRQFDRLQGIAILFPQAEKGDRALEVGYLNAPDDTTLHSMLVALRGLALRRRLPTVLWKMPTGLGLEQPTGRANYKRMWDDDGALLLYERPLRP